MKKMLALAAAAVAVVTLGATPAGADDISIDVTTDPDANAITLDLFNGSPQTASVLLEYTETGTGGNPEDGKSGCNLTGQGSYVTFPVVVQTVSGTAPTLDQSSVTFTDCNDTETIGISATAVGSVSVTLGEPIYASGSAPVTWNTNGASFSITVVDSTPAAALDATEIANAYLGDRADNSDCKAAWGTTGKPKQADWHGKLISAVAHHYQGQTFTEANRSIVEDAVERSCTTTPRQL